jgi:hypothetical protein
MYFLSQGSYDTGGSHSQKLPCPIAVSMQSKEQNQNQKRESDCAINCIGSTHLPVRNPNVPGAKQVALSPTVSQTTSCTRKGRRPHEQRHCLRTHQTTELNNSRIDVCTRSSYSSNVRATVMAPPPEMSNDDAPRVTISSPGRVTMGTPAQSTSPALVCALYLGNFMRDNQIRQRAVAQGSIHHQPAGAQLFDVLVIILQLALKQKPILVNPKCFSLSLKIEGRKTVCHLQPQNCSGLLLHQQS